MYWGWSQVLPFQVVELDPKNGFKEIGKPVVCFFGNYAEHGFERRRSEDVIFPYFTHRPYFPEESPWIEGPWMIKHNGKYYLQYAAIGLEFLSYSHGVYVYTPSIIHLHSKQPDLLPVQVMVVLFMTKTGIYGPFV